MEIKSFSKKSFAVFLAVIHVAIGLVAGIGMMIVGIIDATTMSAQDNGLTLSQVLINGFLMVTLAPVAYGFWGGVLGFFLAAIYNFSARHVGGIRFILKD